MSRRIFVCCPAGATTGGPEALHQLVDALRSQGHDASISYVPFSRSNTVPPAYSRYDVVSDIPSDDPGSVVLVAESMTSLLLGFRRAQRVVWWLSVDFYLGSEHRSVLVDRCRYLYRLARRKSLTFRELRGCLHGSQSAYATQFVQNHGVGEVLPLTDYLHEELLAPVEPASPRRPLILYNPKKGLHVTRALMKACPDFRFQALAGLTRAQLRELLTTSQMYIDFGHHPGRDRLPREAAASGCVVITNRKGSAGLQADLPIPERFKLDDGSPDLVPRFRSCVEEITADFEGVVSQYRSFVEAIGGQRRVFFEQADALARRVAD